jgi:hypothetical protein
VLADQWRINLEHLWRAGAGDWNMYPLYQDCKYPIELKVKREKDSLETILAKGLAQLSGYMDSLGCRGGWLLIFDKRKGGVS